jgi:hypothetical protein
VRAAFAKETSCAGRRLAHQRFGNEVFSIAGHSISRPHPIVGLATVREVAGIFRSQKDIDVAVNATMLSDFDHLQADVIDSLDQLQPKPENVGPEKLTDATSRRRPPFITRGDFTLSNVLIASIVGAVSGAMDLDEVASGENGLAVSIDTILVGFAFAGISSLLTTRLLRDAGRYDFWPILRWGLYELWYD